MTDFQAAVWVRRSLLVCLLGGLLALSFVIVRPFLVPLAWAGILTYVTWPLNAWLVPVYSAAAPPVASLFAMMTKVGIYTLLRLSTLIFSADAGVSARFGAPLFASETYDSRTDQIRRLFGADFEIESLSAINMAGPERHADRPGIMARMRRP